MFPIAELLVYSLSNRSFCAIANATILAPSTKSPEMMLQAVAVSSTTSPALRFFSPTSLATALLTFSPKSPSAARLNIIVKKTRHVVRVPMGLDQAAAYQFHLQAK